MSGSEMMLPPRLSRYQADPFHDQWLTVLSAARPTTSIRLGPHETAPGPDISVPPRSSQLLKFPSYPFCTRWLLALLAKKQRRPQGEMSGSESMPPPTLSR